MADALKSGWLQLVDDTSYTASKKKTPKEREEWRVSMTSRIHHDTDAESIKESEVTEDNGKWTWIYIMTIFVIAFIDKVAWWIWRWTRSMPLPKPVPVGAAMTAASQTEENGNNIDKKIEELRQLAIWRGIECSDLAEHLDDARNKVSQYKAQALDTQDSFIANDIGCDQLASTLDGVIEERDRFSRTKPADQNQLDEMSMKLMQLEARGGLASTATIEVQVDTLNRELDECNHQCEVLFRRVGGLEEERHRLLRFLEETHYQEYIEGEPEPEANSDDTTDSWCHANVFLSKMWNATLSTWETVHDHIGIGPNQWWDLYRGQLRSYMVAPLNPLGYCCVWSLELRGSGRKPCWYIFLNDAALCIPI